MVPEILALADSILKIWLTKLSRQYIDKFAQLKRDYYAEFNKPEGERSDAVLDNLRFELRITAAQLAADVSASNVKVVDQSTGV